MPVSSEPVHAESWQFSITPEEGERWPDTKIPILTRGQAIRPDRIAVTLTRGNKQPKIYLHGSRLLQSGRPGSDRAGYAVFGDRAPWAQEIVAHQRDYLRLGPARTGVPW